MNTLLDEIQLENELLEAREALACRERLQLRAVRVECQLVLEQRSLQLLAGELAASDFDPRRLERTGFSGLVFMVLGGKRGRIDRNRQDALGLLLRWENCSHRAERLTRDLAALHQKVSALDSAVERCAALGAWREGALLQLAACDLGQRLDENSAALLDARGRVSMLKVGMETGERVLSGLQRLSEALLNAQSWGVWDGLSGGKTSNSFKQDSLDEVLTALQITQPMLLRFQFELDEIAGAARELPAAKELPAAEELPAAKELPGEDLPLENSVLAQFPDIFIDCLLADFLEGRPVIDAQEAAAAVTERVRDLLARISRRLVKANHELQSLEAARRGIQLQANLV